MKFTPHPMIRYYAGVGSIFLFVGLPLILSVVSVEYTSATYPGEEWIVPGFCLILAVPGCLLLHYAFWEKCFSTLVLNENEIRWKCPFRKDRVILLVNCAEIGAYLENKGNGIPSEQIYFSDYPDPQKNMKKNGIMKPSQHLIKFFYSKELSNYLLENYSEKLTWRLYEYCQKRQQRY